MEEERELSGRFYNDSFYFGVNYTLSQEYREYEHITDILQRYVVPVIILTGCFGNIVSFITFVASPLRKVSTSVYLAALAFSDTGFLVCLGIGWLEAVDIRFFHKDGICQLTVYASFVFSFTSVWFVLAFTTEMYLAVFHPRKSPSFCTPKAARKVVVALTAVAGLIYLYVFWIAKLVETHFTEVEVCQIIPNNEKTAMIMSVCDTLLTLVIPFSTILFMITRIFVHLTKFYGTNGTEVDQPSYSESDTTTASNRTPVRSVPRNGRPVDFQAKLTRMLVVTAVVFLVLNLPSHAIKVQYLIRSFTSEHVRFTETEGFIQIVFQMLYYANFAVNFILYSACARSFRHALLRVSCTLYCKRFKNFTSKLNKFNVKTRVTRGSDASAMNINEQQHSRLVDIHLQEICYSQLASFESQFVCQSPPCLLNCESENGEASRHVMRSLNE